MASDRPSPAEEKEEKETGPDIPGRRPPGSNLLGDHCLISCSNHRVCLFGRTLPSGLGKSHRICPGWVSANGSAVAETIDATVTKTAKVTSTISGDLDPSLFIE